MAKHYNETFNPLYTNETIKVHIIAHSHDDTGKY